MPWNSSQHAGEIGGGGAGLDKDSTSDMTATHALLPGAGHRPTRLGLLESRFVAVAQRVGGQQLRLNHQLEALALGVEVVRLLT